jgi:hypothetical protein
MQSAEFELKGKTTVPEAVDKAKKSVVSFEKQVEDIQKKFSTSFKDIFLGFTAPMVLIQNAISLISEAIAKAKQDAKDGLDLLAKGETTYATSEEKKMANFFKRRADAKEEQRLVEAGKSELAGHFIKTPEGDKLATDMAAKRISQLGVGAQIDISAFRDSLKGDKQFQDAALKAFLESPEGKGYKPIFDSKNSQNFKGPEGVNSIIGMGNNAVGQAIMDQLDEARKHTVLLEQLASASFHTSPDFTKPHQNTAPSRSAYLKK